MSLYVQDHWSQSNTVWRLSYIFCISFFTVHHFSFQAAFEITLHVVFPLDFKIPVDFVYWDDCWDFGLNCRGTGRRQVRRKHLEEPPTCVAPIQCYSFLPYVFPVAADFRLFIQQQPTYCFVWHRRFWTALFGLLSKPLLCYSPREQVWKSCRWSNNTGNHTAWDCNLCGIQKKVQHAVNI